ncbi:6-phosphofructokinase [Flavipsychrobacter stenotrophus]|uniref:ATP-dependent 6-phosphofructokinase n=1 Tax=Flavipsychrobacter stenotrophus TaxID=2077091 RepID=A0A2S7T0J4_9BACT|nr:6-phosphofructokinase [Flavipsychrobacter stenotrophus]PQJ12335.1 6-phosphofructokinase [Flavipsychrobacter stenotrophus]
MVPINKIALLTSGGDAPGLNACIRAVVRASIFHNIKVVGIRRGYEGLIDGDFFEMDSATVSNIIQRGGTIQKSSRSPRFKTSDGRESAYQQLKKEGIDAVVLIGGDGSFAGSKAFTSTYNIPWIGIPKTIDNDLTGTDSAIGFDTATNTAMEAIDKIRDTAESHNRIFFVEVMGRDAGFIAYETGINVGAEAICIPETENDVQHLFTVLEKGWGRKKSSLIVVVGEGNEAGGAFKISNDVKEKFPQYDVTVCILGYIQRGGSPSCSDRVLASKLGVAAIHALLNGEKNIMVGEIKGDIVYTPLEIVTKRYLEIDLARIELINILST